jgi:phosphocarrier protein FPr
MTPSTLTVTIQDPNGLHLRKGRDLVYAANRYQAAITASNLSRSTRSVDVKSILDLMQLQARQGHAIRFHATGPDAEEALRTLSQLF